MKTDESNNSIATLISAIFLVGGTCIGGGMLALPIATGIGGFFPSIAMMLVSWAAMSATGLLLMEVSLWMEEGAHLITMASRILGRWGKVTCWILYLFICYASIVAYTAGGGAQIAFTAHSMFSFELGRNLGCLIFALVFGGVIYLGSSVVGRVNTVMFVSMIAAYFLLVGVGVPDIKPELLGTLNWRQSLIALPFILTSFSYQTLVPSLTPYLKRNIKYLRIAIVAGTFVAFTVYAVWQALILGIVPLEGDAGLSAAMNQGVTANAFVKEHVSYPWIGFVAEYFAFFAITTSFLGMALGLFDFLSDGLKIPKKGFGNVLLGLLIIVPTYFFASQYERIFLLALDATGGYGDTILNGIIPVLLVWKGRSALQNNTEYRMGGGKTVLVILFVFYSAVLVQTLLTQFGHLTSIYEAYYDMLQIQN